MPAFHKPGMTVNIFLEHLILPSTRCPSWLTNAHAGSHRRDNPCGQVVAGQIEKLFLAKKDFFIYFHKHISAWQKLPISLIILKTFDIM
jgi:hypothetical protein